MSKTRPPRIIFITGTDTGVGKTLLTALLLHHVRQSGCPALAIKPFCSGSRADTRFLHAVQEGCLTLDQITPFHFAEPLAPLVAARKHRRSIRLADVLRHINEVADRCPCLLIEGIGGLMVPLGEGFAVRDLIAELACRVVVVAPNRLGTINHTVLTVEALQVAGIQYVTAVLMSLAKPDSSAKSNPGILVELLAPIPVLPVPFMGPESLHPEALKKSEKKVKKTLARILG